MVEEGTYKGLRAYRCENCGHHYAGKRKAKQCELYCEEHDTCEPSLHSKSFEKDKEVGDH